MPQKIRIGDILELERIPVTVDPEASYIQIGIRSFGKGVFHRPATSGLNLSKLRYFEVHPNRLIVSNIMAWEGAIAHSTQADTGTVGSNRFLSYAPKGPVDLRYLNYYFQSEAGRKLVAGTSTGTVLRNQTLSMKDFESLLVPLPELEEQCRVASRLDRISRALELISERRERSMELRQQFLDVNLRTVIREVPFGDFLTRRVDPVDVDPAANYKIAGIYSFGRGLIRRPAIAGSETAYSRLTELREGELVISKLGAWEGALAVVPSEFTGAFVSPEFPVFTVDSTQCDVGYLRHLVRWPRVREALATRGSMARRKRTSPEMFLSVSVPLPSLPEQRSITTRLDKIETAVRTADKQIGRVQDLWVSALNTALAGYP